ncbi:MAG: PD-(D/E)XK nuclease family protein, partial [Mucilaginibacter polytrichastri]|nr:PD-(D/E)XK nuclease family protein [Mucilaginibacter polytrichastri]
TIGHTAQAKSVAPFFADKISTAIDADPEKTAIILADENLLIPVLQTLPSGNTKVNVTMGYPLAQSTVFGLVEIWLTVQEQVHIDGKSTIYYRDVDAFLSHPLIGISQPERDRLQKMMHESSLVEVPLTDLHFATSLSPNFFTVKHDGLSSIDALYLLLTAVLEQRQRKSELQQLEAALLIEVCRVLNQLYDGLAQHNAVLSLPFVFSLIRRSLRGLSVPLEGEPLRGIQVMGLLESRCLDFENLIILGANEGIMPKTGTTSTFIPDSLRRAYGLPVLENQDAISAYLFYRLLHRSSKISVVYNALVDESNSGEPSRFLKQLEFESCFRFEYHRQQQSVQAGQVSPIFVHKKGKVWEMMQRFFINRNRWDDEKISATALTTYLNCRLQFFFRYIAKIREPEEMPDQLEANQVGTLLHQVLEWFYQQMLAEDPLVTSARIREKIDKKEVSMLSRQALSQLLFGKGKTGELKKPNAMQSIILKIVEEYALTLLKHDMQNAAPFRIVELENKKDYRLAFPVTVSGEQKKVNLYGIIDRVDEQNGHLRIV